MSAFLCDCVSLVKAMLRTWAASSLVVTSDLSISALQPKLLNLAWPLILQLDIGVKCVIQSLFWGTENMYAKHSTHKCTVHESCYFWIFHLFLTGYIHLWWPYFSKTKIEITKARECTKAEHPQAPESWNSWSSAYTQFMLHKHCVFSLTLSSFNKQA